MIKFQFSYLQGGTEIIKSDSLIKLTRSKSFRLYLIEKTIEGGERRMQQYQSRSDRKLTNTV